MATGASCAATATAFLSVVSAIAAFSSEKDWLQFEKPVRNAKSTDTLKPRDSAWVSIRLVRRFIEMVVIGYLIFCK
ncbi:hypothetical protein DC498_18810 [Terrimonas sp.]|nr:hypothetical protein DC498_18810 [Terrimonas sp.]